MNRRELARRLLPLCLTAAALALPWTSAAAQQVPRTLESPAATAERDAQLVPLPPTPTAPPPSYGPVLEPGRAAPASKEAAGQAPPPAPPQQTPPQPQQKQAPPQKQQQPRPRRAVTQQLTPTPRILGSASEGDSRAVLTYGPRLGTSPAPPSGNAGAAARGSNPATCAGPNCLDSSGQRLGTGIGNSAITPQGQLCTRGLVGVQCF